MVLRGWDLRVVTHTLEPVLVGVTWSEYSLDDWAQLMLGKHCVSSRWKSVVNQAKTTETFTSSSDFYCLFGRRMLNIFSFSEKTKSETFSKVCRVVVHTKHRSPQNKSTNVKDDNRLMEAGIAAEEKANCASTALFFTNGLAVPPSAQWVMI